MENRNHEVAGRRSGNDLRRIPCAGAVCALALAAGAIPGSAESVPVRIGTPSAGLFQEIGMLESGRFSSAGPFRDEWVDHFGAWFLERAYLGENLEIAVGMGGVFQYQKPEVASAGWGGSQYRNFFAGPSQATLAWRAPKAGLTATLGMLPFKYNPEAANLGEYLFRSNPYPGYLVTGGYAVVGAADAYLQGALAEMALGNFKVTLAALTETGFPPLYDGSLAALGSWTSGDGSLTLGAGVNCKRILQVRPSRTSPRQSRNAYFRKGGAWYTGNSNYYRSRLEFAASRHLASDSAYWKSALDSVTSWTADTVSPPDYRYYSAAGTIAMARFTLDPKPWFASGALGPADLKVYAEAALLGVKDYPVFYPEKADRLPVMFGINLPAFRWLDRFAVQGEWHRSPWLNSTERVATVGLPQPFMPRGNDTAFSRDAWYDAARRDDWSWSVLLEKAVMPGLTLSAQAARDHLRLVSLNTWFGPGLEADENLASSKDWYWMCRIGFAI